MDRLIAVTTPEDIPYNYLGTPVEMLLEYHNLNRAHEKFDRAAMLIGMCMDNR